MISRSDHQESGASISLLPNINRDQSYNEWCVCVLNVLNNRELERDTIEEDLSCMISCTLLAA